MVIIRDFQRNMRCTARLSPWSQSFRNVFQLSVIRPSGVRQGLLFDPIRFIIHMNDPKSGLTSNVFKYADDTKIREWELPSKYPLLVRQIDNLVREVAIDFPCIQVLSNAFWKYRKEYERKMFRKLSEVQEEKRSSGYHQ